MLTASQNRHESDTNMGSVKRTLMIVPFSLNTIRVRPVEVLAELMRYSKVDILCLEDGNPIRLVQEVDRLTVIPNGSKLTRFFRILLGLLRGIPINAEFYNSMQLPSVLAAIDLIQYDVIYVHRLPLHRLNLKHPRVIYDAEDCWSNRCRVLASRLSGYKRVLYALDSVLTPRHEVSACNSASIVLTTAEREAVHLRRLGVTVPVEVYIHDRQCPSAPRILQKRRKMVLSFHGKMSYAPNAAALQILNDEIAPRLDATKYELRIIGKCPQSFRGKFPHLSFTGYVESMSDTIRDSDLSVFPLQISVGFSNKTMESLAAGVPLIATKEVVEGLPPIQELLECGVYVREIPEFVEAIEYFRNLSLDERQKIGEKCCAWVYSVYNSPFQKTQWPRLLGISTSPKIAATYPAEDSRKMLEE